jgi:hypothetical protein
MTPAEPKRPKDAQDALDIGFERGRTTRQQTSDPEEKLDFWRKSFEEARGFELECWPGRSMFYEEWHRGLMQGISGILSRRYNHTSGAWHFRPRAVFTAEELMAVGCELINALGRTTYQSPLCPESDHRRPRRNMS